MTKGPHIFRQKLFAHLISYVLEDFMNTLEYLANDFVMLTIVIQLGPGFSCKCLKKKRIQYLLTSILKLLIPSHMANI